MHNNAREFKYNIYTIRSTAYFVVIKLLNTKRWKEKERKRDKGDYKKNK